jgi:hypothetical protein
MLRTISRVRGARRALVCSLSGTSASSGGASTSKTETPSPTIFDDAKPRKWVRPLEPGVLPAYDEALAYIERDAANKRAELARRGQTKDKDGQQWSAEELESLEIESEINLPEVRWNFQQGNSMCSLFF